LVAGERKKKPKAEAKTLRIVPLDEEKIQKKKMKMMRLKMKKEELD
jgi:hypothetical protein